MFSGLTYVIEMEGMPTFYDQCPHGFKPQGDLPILDTLRKCPHKAKHPPEVEQWQYTQVLTENPSDQIT